MRPFSRTDRVAAVIQERVDFIIRRKIKDPRLDGCSLSIAAVKVSKDLSYAKVYVSFLITEQATIDEAMATLKHAASYIRHLLKADLSTHKVPELTFIYDDFAEKSSHISRLIDSL